MTLEQTNQNSEQNIPIAIPAGVPIFNRGISYSMGTPVNTYSIRGNALAITNEKGGVQLAFAGERELKALVDAGFTEDTWAHPQLQDTQQEQYSLMLQDAAHIELKTNALDLPRPNIADSDVHVFTAFGHDIKPGSFIVYSPDGETGDTDGILVWSNGESFFSTPNEVYKRDALTQAGYTHQSEELANDFRRNIHGQLMKVFKATG